MSTSDVGEVRARLKQALNRVRAKPLRHDRTIPSRSSSSFPQTALWRVATYHLAMADCRKEASIDAPFMQCRAAVPCVTRPR
jgi:hypothetical protein